MRGPESQWECATVLVRGGFADAFGKVGVSKDINATLEGWEYDPQRISVRIVKGDDGRDKIQLRLELGLLQMEFEGRPDGRRIDDCESWLEFYERQQRNHEAEHAADEPFLLESDDCQRLLREGVQYYHRYVSFWHLERYELCARDTSRNLRLFTFVRDFARHTKDKLQFDQWRPYVMMMHARAVATPLVVLREYAAALQAIEASIQGIRDFLQEYDQEHNAENCSELSYLLRWQKELQSQTEEQMPTVPPDPLTQWNEELRLAIEDERFEDAARLRDTIRRHSETLGGPSQGEGP